jgi:hypothetical protein
MNPGAPPISGVELIASVRSERIDSDEILGLRWGVTVLFQPEHNWDQRPTPFMHDATIDPAAEPYNSDMKGPGASILVCAR